LNDSGGRRLAETYAEARRQAADETGLDVARFPTESAWSLGELLTDS
jgi:hypothetical protein